MFIMENNHSDYLGMAKDIIKDNMYMVVATSDKDGKPWAAPVFYAYDEVYNFYFLSAVDSRHAENIIENPHVSIVIFNSKQILGVSEGIQMEGMAKEVGERGIDEVISLYSDRLFSNSRIPSTEGYIPKNYLKPSEFRFFKVEIETAYVTGPDRRVKVDLRE